MNYAQWLIVASPLLGALAIIARAWWQSMNEFDKAECEREQWKP